MRGRNGLGVAFVGALVFALVVVAGSGCKKDEPAPAVTAGQAAEEAMKAAEKAGAEASKAADEAVKAAEKAGAEASKAAEEAVKAATAGAPAAAGGAGLGDMAGFLAVIEQRVDRVIDKPKVDEALNRLISAIGSQEEFSEAGDALLAALGQAPEIAVPGAKIVEQLGAHPAMVKLIQDMLQQDPQLAQNPALIEAKMGAHVEAIFAGDAWNKGFDKAFESFSSDPTVDEAFTRLGAAVTEGIDFEKTFGKYFEERISDPAMIVRIKALNAGVEPTPEQAKDLLLKHVFTEGRMETFFVEFFSMEELKKEFAAALLPVLKSPEFKQSLVARLGRVMSDPAFAPIAVNAMITLLQGNLTVDSVSGAVMPLFQMPVMRTEFVALVDDIRTNKGLRDPIGKAFENATKAEAFKAVLDKAFIAGL